MPLPEPERTDLEPPGADEVRHLERSRHRNPTRVAVRVADAMRRGALVDGSIDFLAVDWFELADRTVDELRAHFRVVPKSAAAVATGLVGPGEPGGISSFQDAAGRRLAESEGRNYESFGAAVAPAAAPASHDG